jgi:hypothetical protein
LLSEGEMLPPLRGSLLQGEPLGGGLGMGPWTDAGMAPDGELAEGSRDLNQKMLLKAMSASMAAVKLAWPRLSKPWLATGLVCFHHP